jgi:hypothetical protein
VFLFLIRGILIGSERTKMTVSNDKSPVVSDKKREISMAYAISTSEDSTTFCLQTAHVADKTISVTVTTRPPSIPVCATFHPSTVISLPCCAYIRNTCPFSPHLTVPTTPVKCKAQNTKTTEQEYKNS